MKHKLKLLLREVYARLIYHTGLWILVDRFMPRRLMILAGHCVTADVHNGFLPKDMKIDADRLERILRTLMRRMELVTVGDGFARIRGDGASGPTAKSLVALSMDDGYKDNATCLAPMLERIGVPATIFLESRPLDERRVNWSHKFFWILGRVEPAELLKRYLDAGGAEDTAVRSELELALAPGGNPLYLMKRVLKYDADPALRDTALDRVFVDLGGVERELCDSLYMTWDDARALHANGIELGGHTVGHHVLSSLADERASDDVLGCRDAMQAALGDEAATFAYPFGRNWDFSDTTAQSVAGAGYRCAVTTHAGTNDRDTDPFRLRRWMIDQDAKLHLLVTEAAGGFDLLRRVGLDLSE